MSNKEFIIGSRVHCTDGRCGTLHKLVVDPHTRRVTHLIVEKGFLQKKDRVIPVTAVSKVEDEDIYLACASADLERYPVYREKEFELPAPEWRAERKYGEHEVFWGTYYGLDDYPEVVPKQRYRVQEGIPSDLETIGAGLPVYNVDGVVGRLHHVLVNPETDEITHLVVRKGIFPYRLVIPMDAVTAIDSDGVSVSLNNEELKKLSRYTERPDVDILEELRDRFNADALDFDHVTATIERGVLQLRGFVEDMAAKRRAEEIGRSVPGVIDVENLIDTSAAIVARVTAALQSDPRTRTAVIEVINDRGVITLSGEVDSAEVRKAAERIAAEQPGVIAVINALEVKPEEVDLDLPEQVLATPPVTPQ